jgi:ABC-type dipeptide/oligopeptide/nickel transport system permease component
MIAMVRFFAWRLLVSVLVAVTVSIVAFSFLRLSGDLPALLAGENAKPQDIARIAAQYGLDRPLYVQYLDWARNALHGDLGRSLFTGEPVSQLMSERIGITFTLALGALVLALLVAVPLGVVAAVRPNSWLDRAALSLAVCGQAIPNFWLALILIYVFGVMLRWLPISGSDTWQHFVLPTITLGFSAMPAFMRLTRTGMIDVLSSDFIRTARAKGLGPVSVLFKHALRNAVLPIVSVAAIQLGFLLGGSVIVESVFAFNGIGFLAFRSITSADFPVVQSILVFLSFGYIFLTLMADLANAKLDPRIRL